MKRVLYIDASCFFGGAQTSLASLIRSRKDREMQFIIAGCRELEPGAAIITHHYKAGLGGFISLLRDARNAAQSIKSAIQQFQPDCVYLNAMRSALLLIFSGLDIKCPVTLHDRDVRCPLFIPRLVNISLKPHIIAISPKVAEKWHFMPSDRISVTPNLFDTDAIASTAPAASPFPDETYKIIMAADFTPWKNHKLLIDAMAILKDKCPAARCLLKGRIHTKDDEKYLQSLKKRICKLGLEGHVLINSDNEPALPHIAACDCLAACSKDEPFGRTLIEAFAMGKTVAAAKYSADSSILEGCKAAAIAEYTPDSLAEAIMHWQKKMIRDNARQAALKKAGDFSFSRN